MMQRAFFKRPAGFTLIELVIACSIVAILATIALPSYSRYVLRSNRAVARGVLVDLAAKQELAKLQTQAYATGFDTLVTGASGTSYFINRNGAVESTSMTDSIYKITLSSGNLESSGCATSASAGAFSLIATPVAGGPQARDTDCATLCVSSIGLRGSSPQPVTTCWSQ